MICPACQAQNLEDAEYCTQCGTRLSVVCPSCQTANRSVDKFCRRCGQRLGAPGSTVAPNAYTPKHLAEKILTSRSALEGERKRVTVLFCDIVDSSRLAEHLGPEGMHEVMDRALRLMAEAVHRYEGTVNQFLGDGLMALFGAPVALEDHALRAVQAALTIRETISGYSEQLKRERGMEIRLRLGLNTGLVVVGKIGDDLRMDYTAVGDTTHLAARMQTLAEPGTILTTEATHRLVEGYIRSEAIGPVEVKGRSEPVLVYRVTGRRRARTRLEVSAERGLTPLVGRDRELGVLRDCLGRVKGGRGQVVGIVGEAGVGKSRLLYELRKSLEGERVTWLEGHCLAYGQATPYLPILDVLRMNFQIEEGDNPLQIQQKLRQGLRQLDPTLEGILPFLGELFTLPPADDTLKKLDPKDKRQNTFEAIRALTMAGSQRRPHVVIMEDLHWIDKTSEDYLFFLTESLAAMPLLLVTTQRPGYAVRWADKTYYGQIALDLLTEQETAAILVTALGSPDFPQELVRLVQEKAEGNPLFVEEITRSLMERGILVRKNGGVSWAGEALVLFPPTVQDIIRARIDRLEEPVKRTLQTAAVIGREFSLRLLTRISGTAAEAQRCLDILKHLEFIHEIRFFPEPEYSFKHAVIQDVAYQTLLVQRRKEIHRRIGLAIEELSVDRLAEQYEVLAHHFSEAGAGAKAIEYLVKAGDKATKAYANREALAFYEKALGLAAAADKPRRAEVFEKLAGATTAVVDMEASLRYAQSALELYEGLGNRRGMFDMHMHLQMLYTGGFRDGSREDMAVRHLEAAAAIADEDPNSVQKGLIYQRTGHLYLHRAQPAVALAWFRKAVDLFALLGVPLGTAWGTARAYTGSIDEGIAYSEKNWEPVLRTGNPIIIGVFGHEISLLLALGRDIPRAREWGERVLPQAQKTKITFVEGFLQRPLSLIYTLSGEPAKAEGASQAAERVQTQTFQGCHFEDGAAVGFYQLRRGNWDDVSAYLERAIPIHRDRNNVGAVGACSFVLGALHLEQGNHATAETPLRTSLDICRDGGNVLFELWVLPVLAELYLRMRQPDKAAEQVARGFELLKPDQNWYGLPAPMHMAKGMLAAARKNWDEAEQAFAEAVAINRRYQLPWDEAKALYEWGLMHLARNQAGDPGKAREKLGSALKIFQSVGAKKDVEKILAAKEQLGP